MSDLKIKVKCGDCEIEYDSKNYKESCNPAHTAEGYSSQGNGDALIKVVNALADSVIKMRGDL